MKIKDILWQHRRDFSAIFECEHCGFEIQIDHCYDDEIVIINEVIEDESDLMQDFISLVTSFCARIYGKRRTKRKTEQIIKELSSTDD